MKIVRVTWHDALAVAMWYKHSEPMAAQVCVTVGFLVAEDDQHVMVAATVSDDEFIAAMQIPRGMIRAMDEIVPSPLFTVQ
jgi:hypothetical protein